MFCQTCGASHQPEDRFCDACGASLPADDDAAVKAPAVASGVLPHAPMWVTAAAGVLLITTIGFSAAWCSAGRQRDSAVDAKNTLEAQVRSLETERNGLSAQREVLAERFALAGPLITGYRLTNKRYVSETEFVWENAPFYDRRSHYIYYEVSGPNQSYGIRDLKGELKVKYLGPTGSMLTGASSPPGFSMSSTIEIPKAAQDWKSPMFGFGNKQGTAFSMGSWTIEFYWADRIIGKTSFYVYAALF